jgi:hypothetical protein
MAMLLIGENDMAQDRLSFAIKSFVPLVGLGVVVLAFTPISFAHMIATTPESSGQRQRAYSDIIHLEQDGQRRID